MTEPTDVKVRNLRSGEVRVASYMGHTGPGPQVMLEFAPEHVDADPNGCAMSPIHRFSLNSGRSPGAMKEWALAPSDWRGLVEWWRTEVRTKVAPRYGGPVIPVKKPKKADPRQGDLF